MQAAGFSFIGWNGGRKAPWRNGIPGMGSILQRGQRAGTMLSGIMIDATDRVDRRVWVIAAACSCGPLMSGLDSTMVNVSLDTLSSAFGVSLGTIQLVT